MGVTCVTRLWAETPQAFKWGFLADRLVHTVLAVLSITGVINRTGFLIGIASLSTLEVIGVVAIARSLGCCDKRRSELIFALVVGALNAIPCLSMLTGKMTAAGAASFGLTVTALVFLGPYLVAKGVDRYMKAKHGVSKLPF